MAITLEGVEILPTSHSAREARRIGAELHITTSEALGLMFDASRKKVPSDGTIRFTESDRNRGITTKRVPC